MQITKIYSQKSGHGLNIDIDNSYAFSLRSTRTLTNNNLYKDREISQEDISRILLDDFYHITLEQSIAWVSRRPRSQKETDRYLKKKLNSFLRNNKIVDTEDVIQKLKKRLYELDLLNDEKFTDFWIRSRNRSNKKGKQYIKKELLQKGISKDIIDSKLNNISENQEFKKAYFLAKKKLPKINSDNSYEKKNKLKRYLYQRGFSFNIINRIVKEFW